MSTVDFIMQSAKRVPLLTPEEEITLGRQVQAMVRLQEAKAGGKYTKAEQLTIRRGRRARDRFVSANIRLVVTVAGKFERWMARLDMSVEDMIQEGCIGLTRAAERFDPERGYKFSTYAYWWIRQGIQRAIYQQGRGVRLPVHVCELLAKSGPISRRMRQELGREPTLREIAAELKVDQDYLEHVLLIGGRHVSLDIHAIEGGAALHELLPADATESNTPETALENDIHREQLAEAMKYLSDREREVIELRNGLAGEPLTLAEIGRRAGVSRERIRHIETAAVAKLRRLVAV